MYRFRVYGIILWLTACVMTVQAYADEGMWPLNEIHKINLKSKGLNIKVEDIYNPNGISLAQAIVRTPGCTGSFVSEEGLILTNHHCSYGIIQSASSMEHDYLKEGFLARTRSEEYPAKNFYVRFIESFKDITAEILSAVSDTMDALSRATAIQDKSASLLKSYQNAYPGQYLEISEMLPGKSYILFVYTTLTDIRLVYAPPQSIGEFGGETDNWVWPRHTGDFSFIRAYVGKDGKPAEYSPDNVPYRPKKFIRIQPDGVRENDFVFVLGYPGRTFRHRPADFLAYEEEVRMPYLADLMDWHIQLMEQAGAGDRAVAIKLADKIKGLANTTKNFRGKLKGMKRLQLVENKRKEEQELQNFIESDPNRSAKYKDLLKNIRTTYDAMRPYAEFEFILDYITRNHVMLSVARTVHAAVYERQKPDSLRSSSYQDKNIDQLRASLQKNLKDYHEATDRALLTEIVTRMLSIKDFQSITLMIDSLYGMPARNAIPLYTEKIYRTSRLMQDSVVLAYLDKTPAELKAMNDPFIQLNNWLAPLTAKLRQMRQEREALLNKYHEDLLQVRMEYLKTSFIPDANRTFRFTYGYVRGYSPADAVYYAPFTTLKGLVDKTGVVAPWDTPSKVIDLYKKKDYGRYADKKLRDVPVAMIYNSDTTGGNSGSPVLNARGELIGLNFDRCFEATINDFAWSEAYSRSIGVDVRYILWLLEKYAGADHLLREMKII